MRAKRRQTRQRCIRSVAKVEAFPNGLIDFLSARHLAASLTLIGDGRGSSKSGANLASRHIFSIIRHHDVRAESKHELGLAFFNMDGHI